MGIEQGTGLLNDIFTNTTVFNVEWLFSIIFVVMTLAIITRDVEKWRILALPVTIMWHIVGIKPSMILYIFVGILFVLEAFSMQVAGNVVGTVQEMFTGKERTEDKVKKQVFNKKFAGYLNTLSPDQLSMAIGKRKKVDIGSAEFFKLHGGKKL
jgi:hypothetical protein